MPQQRQSSEPIASGYPVSLFFFFFKLYPVSLRCGGDFCSEPQVRAHPELHYKASPEISLTFAMPCGALFCCSFTAIPPATARPTSVTLKRSSEFFSGKCRIFSAQSRREREKKRKKIHSRFQTSALKVSDRCLSTGLRLFLLYRNNDLVGSSFFTGFCVIMVVLTIDAAHVGVCEVEILRAMLFVGFDPTATVRLRLNFGESGF